MRRSWGFLLLLLVPATASAQLTPGGHYLSGHVGAQFSQNELLKVTTEYPPLRSGETSAPVRTQTSLDPGLYLSLRYSYALNRKLSLDIEGSWGVAVHVIEQQELREGENLPVEQTTTDTHITNLFASLSYFLGPYYVTSPFFTVGMGQRVTDLRQKGSIDPDPIYNGMLMAGFGFMLTANENLHFRVDLRDYMYNFYYDNQFADPNYSHEILGIRDIGIAVRESQPRWQHDLTVTFSVQVKIAG